MSCTEIYSVGENHCEYLGETKNAWRGAMYVWNSIAQKYFGLDGFPIFDDSMQKRIWNADNEHDLPEHEKIVLASTMDSVVVKKSDIGKLVTAFEQYAIEHPNSSIGEQLEIIKHSNLEDGHMIAWLQTSVSEFCFAPDYDDDENPIYNDLSSAWSLFSDDEDGE